MVIFFLCGYDINLVQVSFLATFQMSLADNPIVGSTVSIFDLSLLASLLFARYTCL